MTNYDFISYFYEKNVLTPSLEWYRNCKFISNDQYNEIKGNNDSQKET